MSAVWNIARGGKPPPLWRAAEAAAATDGRSSGGWVATGVSIDSRTVQPGDLFVALKGPSFDGHDYVADALARGAAAAMVHRADGQWPVGAPLLRVRDTMSGLESLGIYARLRSEARVVAVTGSVGKTGTKEALRTALADQGATHASAGNLNNQWGTPLSLARMPADSAFGVFELGMNHPGEIAPLSRQVKPHVAIITTVAAAHLGNFDSEAQIADAKAEIFSGMGPDTTAVLNRDNPHYARLLAHARTQGIGRIWCFGESVGADARLLDCSLHATCSAVSAVIRGEPLQYSLPLAGRHWVLNSLAVLLAVRALGGDLALAARSLAKLQAVPGRGARRRLRLAGEGAAGSLVLIDESYNASPVSVAAALDVLGRSDPGTGGRRIAVLGDMLELGDDASALHRGLRPLILANEVDQVFTCGPHMGDLFATLPDNLRGAHGADSAALAPLVAAAVGPGDVVMIKGSLGSRMDRVIAALDRLDTGDAAATAPTAAKRHQGGQ